MLTLSNFHFKRLLAPSEALVFIMVYYIPRKPLFQIFQIRKGKWKWKNLTCAIFLKSMEFKGIKYDIPVCQIHYIYKDIYKDIHKLTERPVVLLNAIFLGLSSVLLNWITFLGAFLVLFFHFGAPQPTSALDVLSLFCLILFSYKVLLVCLL